MTVIKEFALKIGANVKPAQDSIKNLQNSADVVVGHLSKLAGALGVTFGAIATFNNIVNAGNELQRFSDLTGIAVDDTSALGNVLEKFGGNSQSAMNTLKNLQNAMNDYSKGSGALVDLHNQFGISISSQGGKLTNTKKALMELSDQFKNLSKQNALMAGQKLGLDESTILLLQQGSRGVEELLDGQKALGVITSQDSEDMQKFNNILIDLKQMFMKIALQLVKIVLPPLQKLVSWITKFFTLINGNRRIVLSFLSAIAIALTPILLTLTQTAIASAATFAPFYAAAAVVTAIALVIEDIWAYLQGADSITGELVKKWPVLGSIIEGIRATILTIVGYAKQIWDYFSNLTFEKLLGDIGHVKDKLLNMIPDWLKPNSWKSKNDNPKITNNTSNNHQVANNTNNNNITFNQQISTNNPKEFAKQTNDNIKNQLSDYVRANSQGGY